MPGQGSLEGAEPDWAQGDVFNGGQAAVFGDAAEPCSEPLQAITQEGQTGVVLVQLGLERFVVISQTCDLVRSTALRPYVHIAAVVERTDPNSLKGDQPRFVPLPWVDGTACADLDTIAILEKPLLRRVCQAQAPARPDHHQGRRFAHALGRFYSRFAFPDDVSSSLTDLAEVFKAKHGKIRSPLHEPMQQVSQIRASVPGGDWEAPVLDVTLHFIVEASALPPFDPEEADVTPETTAWLDTPQKEAAVAERLLTTAEPADRHALWSRLAAAWVERCEAAGRVVTIEAEVHSDSDFPASRFWATERLDLDHLSKSDGSSTER